MGGVLGVETPPPPKKRDPGDDCANLTRAYSLFRAFERVTLSSKLECKDLWFDPCCQVS